MGNVFKDDFRKVWFGEGFRKIREIYKRTEIQKGTVISKEEYLRRVEDVERRIKEGGDRFLHCEICPARWGVAGS